METIIVNIIVAAVFVLFAVMAIGPMMIDVRGTGSKRGEILHLPLRKPQNPSDGQRAA